MGSAGWLLSSSLAESVVEESSSMDADREVVEDEDGDGMVRHISAGGTESQSPHSG